MNNEGNAYHGMDVTDDLINKIDDLEWSVYFLAEAIKAEDRDVQQDLAQTVIKEIRKDGSDGVTEIDGIDETLEQVMESSETNELMNKYQSCESAFRRGYTHAYNDAMDVVRTLLTPDQWEEWCDFFNYQLMMWRRGGLKEPVPPVYEFKSTEK